jgi:hypothetical protein
MKTSTRTSILCALAAPLALGAGALLADEPASSTDHDAHRADKSSTWTRSPLVKKVRAATRRYKDINVAIEEGWVPATPCVSGPNSGAMGVHYVLPERIGDGAVRADQPEALIYEPMSGGRARLVGVEFIVIAADWNTQNPDKQPTLEGHLMNLVGEPNRYRLPAFYELHVWAWERNDSGSFADWNEAVTCDAQPLG